MTEVKIVGNVKKPTNWSSLATAVTGNPVASAFIYNRMIYSVLTALVGLKPSTTSGSNNRTVMSQRFTEQSLEEEGGVIIGTANAFNGVNETTGKGSLHFHVNLWAAITSSILQDCVEVQSVCNEISYILESMYCTEVPRKEHVKDLVEKELLLYPNQSTDNKPVCRGRAMIMPPDPVENAKEFYDFVHQTILYCGMHSHDKSINSTCHKGP